MFRRGYAKVSALVLGPEGAAAFDELLPRSAYVQEVADLAKSAAWREKEVPMSLCVGPAIKWARLGALLLWTANLLNCLLTYSTVKCDHASSSGRSWLEWALYGAVMAVMFPGGAVLEFVCLRFTTVPFVQVTREFKMLGLRVAYWTWLAFTFLVSALSRADMLTDGAFVAALLRREQCPGEDLTDLWGNVMSNSLLPGLACLKLSHIALFLYLLTFAQCVWPLMQSIPQCCGPPVDYCIAPAATDPSRKMSDLNFEFTNIVGEHVKLGDVIMMLGEAAGMASLQLQSPAYPLAKTRLEPEKAMSLARAAVSRGVVSIGLVAVLENSLQIQLQVSIFAMHFFKTKSYQGFAVASLALSLAMLALKLKDAFKLLSFSTQVRTSAGEESNNSAHFRYLLRYTRVLQMMVLLLLLSLFYGVAKFVAAFICRDSLWNLTGCVDLQALA